MKPFIFFIINMDESLEFHQNTEYLPGLAAHSCIASKAPSGLATFEINSSTGQFPSFI